MNEKFSIGSQFRYAMTVLGPSFTGTDDYGDIVKQDVAFKHLSLGITGKMKL